MMNGLSQVFDQIVTNSYLGPNSGTGLSSETSIGQQLAFEAFADKALAIESTGIDSDFTFSALNDSADHCLNNYFCDQQLTQNWNQFNENPNQLNDNNVINDSLINSNDFSECLNSFDTSFETNSNTVNTNTNNTNTKQNNKKSNPKTLSNTKKLSRKESAASVRPSKPVSAYALFFRDAQSLIKSSNPSASFGDISKVVASNWEALDTNNKNIYKQRADQQKKNYLKTLASSRAKQIAGLMAESTAKLGISSSSQNNSQSTWDSVLSDNRLTNETNRQNDKTNSFESTQQISDNKGSHSMRANTNANQSFADNQKSSQQLQQNLVSTSDQSGSAVPKQHCIRSGCSNDAIDSPEWDSEYCSSECCVKHCSDVFQAWVQRQQFPQNN